MSKVDGPEKNEERGRELHREFVGMLFALAIAEVAVEGSAVANSSLTLREAAPTYAHLILAAAVICTSWVGWGWSKHGLSNVRHVFTLDFVELVIDLWLVTVYFFIVKGVELPAGAATATTLTPSMSNEVFWLMVVFLTYVLWDVLTKLAQRNARRLRLFAQRGWASVTCAALAMIAYWSLPLQSTNAVQVLLADGALLCLVFLFRAMKLRNLSALSAKNWIVIVSLVGAYTFLLISARA